MSLPTGATALAGWVTQVPVIVGQIGGLIPMQVQAAVSFLLLGAVLLVASVRPSRPT